MATSAGPRKTALYLGVSILSMYTGSCFVQALVRTDMDLTHEIEKVREQRRIERYKAAGSTSNKSIPGSVASSGSANAPATN